MELVNFIKIKITIMMTIINIIYNSKLYSNSHSNSLSHSDLILSGDNNSEQYSQTNQIDVYVDKELAQKLLSFDKLSYIENKNKEGVVDGLIFNTTKSNNKGIADNYFMDKGTKICDGKILIRFTNFDKCEVVSKSRYDHQIVLISIINNFGSLSYLSISYGTDDKQDKNKIASNLNNLCSNYMESLKKRLNELWLETQNYWKLKEQVQQMADKIKQVNEKMKKENDNLAQVVTDKNNFEKSMNEDLARVNKTKDVMDSIQKQLKSDYKTMNDLKEHKALVIMNMSLMNDTLTKLKNETKVTQARLEAANKISDEMRNKSNDIIKAISNIKNNMSKLETNLTNQRENQSSIDQKINKLNKEINDKGKEVAQLNKDIKINKDQLDKLKLQDLPHVIDKTKEMVDQANNQSKKALKETNLADKNIKKSNEAIKNNTQTIRNMSSSADVVKLNKNINIRKNIEKARNVFNTLRKTFPSLSDVFANNLFNYIYLNHFEAMNYIQALSPSKFGIYNNLYSKNHPSMEKRRRLKIKRKLRKLRKLR